MTTKTQTRRKPPPSLSFKVSTGLKRVLGKELITEAQVAIFELVKNSYDASATRVEIFFEGDRIVVADNGSGMTFADLRDKWLFVAYSEKRGASRADGDFRDHVAERQSYAGSKGVGRLSTDRLGAQLNIQTRHKREKNGPVEVLDIDWNDFEGDDRREINEVPVRHSNRDKFDLPQGLTNIQHGTVIELSGSGHVWPRNELKKLKQSLAKLINPFGGSTDGFAVTIVAPDEDRVKVLRKAQVEQFSELKTKFFPYSAVMELYSICERRKLRGVTDEFLDCFMEDCVMADREEKLLPV